MESISIADYRGMLQGGAKVRLTGSRKKKRNAPEEDLQRACVEWAELASGRYPLLRRLIHVPNGGKRSKGEAGKMKAMGVKKGVLDLLLPLPSGRYPGFAVELKAPGGKTTPEQDEWLEDFHQAGWLTGVCYSLQEFIDLAMRFLDQRGL
jgi:hypothetical protein